MSEAQNPFPRRLTAWLLQVSPQVESRGNGIAFRQSWGSAKKERNLIDLGQSRFFISGLIACFLFTCPSPLARSAILGDVRKSPPHRRPCRIVQTRVRCSRIVSMWGASRKRGLLIDHLSKPLIPIYLRRRARFQGVIREFPSALPLL